MNKILIALLSSAVSAGVTWFITKHVYNKKMDTLANKATDEINNMRNQLDALHKEFVVNRPIEEAVENMKKWDNIASQTKIDKEYNDTLSVLKTYSDGKSDEEVVTEFRQNILAGRELAKQRTNYAELTKSYDRESPSFGERIPNAKVILPEDGPTIKEISMDEFADEEVYEKSYLSLYEDERMLYDEDGTELSCKGVLGVSLDELLKRANEDGEDAFYFKDIITERAYQVDIYMGTYEEDVK